MSADAAKSASKRIVSDARKRKRKTRSRKRSGATARTAGDEEAGSEDSGGSDEEVHAASGAGPAPSSGAKEGVNTSQVMPTTSTNKSSSFSSSSSSSSSSSDSDSESADLRDKPKRRRTRKRKGASGTAISSASVAQPTQTPLASIADPPSVSASTSVTLASLERPKCPDPQSETRLGESAKASLIYAHQYFYDRPRWKFAKARQTWLLRHVLSLPPLSFSPQMPLEADASLTAEPPGPEAGTTADVSTQDTQQSQTDALQSAWFPDDYVPLVGGYLGTMQGAGKQGQRLIQELREALVAPSTTREAQPDGVSVSASVGSSVPASTTFGPMAVAQEAAAVGTQDPAWVEGRRQRARDMLRAIGQDV